MGVFGAPKCRCAVGVGGFDIISLSAPNSVTFGRPTPPCDEAHQTGACSTWQCKGIPIPDRLNPPSHQVEYLHSRCAIPIEMQARHTSRWRCRWMPHKKEKEGRKERKKERKQGWHASRSRHGTASLGHSRMCPWYRIARKIAKAKNGRPRLPCWVGGWGGIIFFFHFFSTHHVTANAYCGRR